MRCSTGLPFSPARMMAMAKMMVNTMSAIRLLLENSSGKSPTVNMPRKFMLLVMFSTSSVMLSTAPLAGSNSRAATTINRQEITPVIIVPPRKVTRIFRSLARFSILAMAAVSEQKISGTTQQYSKFRNRSATGWSTAAPSPQKKPTTPPTTIAPSNIIEDLYVFHSVFIFPPFSNIPHFLLC